MFTPWYKKDVLIYFSVIIFVQLTSLSNSKWPLFTAALYMPVNLFALYIYVSKKSWSGNESDPVLISEKKRWKVKPLNIEIYCKLHMEKKKAKK